MAKGEVDVEEAFDSNSLEDSLFERLSDRAPFRLIPLSASLSGEGIFELRCPGFDTTALFLLFGLWYVGKLLPKKSPAGFLAILGGELRHNATLEQLVNQNNGKVIGRSK